jgi:hypothetical protein
MESERSVRFKIADLPPISNPDRARIAERAAELGEVNPVA